MVHIWEHLSELISNLSPVDNRQILILGATMHKAKENDFHGYWKKATGVALPVVGSFYLSELAFVSSFVS